jgi:chemotaxis protein MotB
MRRSRRNDIEHPTHDRWLVSYSDFITLLFAFFVVMYAISTLNEGKYKVLSGALNAAFRHDTIAPPALTPILPLNRIGPPAMRQLAKAADAARVKQEQKLRGLASELVTALGPLVQTGQVRLTETALGLAVEINASVLFAPAQATLQPESLVPLQSVAEILKTVDNGIEVQGHTDKLPIATPQYPSNWELSSARASAVIRLFASGGVSPQRLTAVGYADNKPVEIGDTPEALARNRRVTLLISSEKVGSDEASAATSPQPPAVSTAPPSTATATPASATTTSTAPTAISAPPARATPPSATPAPTATTPVAATT